MLDNPSVRSMAETSGGGKPGRIWVIVVDVVCFDSRLNAHSPYTR